MLVVDASVLANALADDGADGALARAALRGAELAAPDLVDVETVSVLRKRWLAGALTVRRLPRAVAALGELALTRHPTLALIPGAGELRSHITPYDAAHLRPAQSVLCPRLSRTPHPST